MDSVTAASRYSALESYRDVYLERARDSAKLTIPALVPHNTDIKAEKLKTPWQGLGARGTNNLASKLLLALFPPNTPYFRFLPDPSVVEEMTTQPEAKTEIESALGKLEKSIMMRIEAMGARVQMFEALKHLIVAGNVLLHIASDGVKVFHLDKYVVKRAPNGEVLEIIVNEPVSYSSLPKEVQELIGEAKSKSSDSKGLNLYTYIKLEDNKYVVHQELDGKVVPKSQGSYPKDKTPWLALRFTKIDGEDYGRGFIEEYYGDLHSLEKLTRAIVEGSAAAAKVLFLINPNGTTRARTLQQAPNGSIREGDSRDISVLQLDKFADFRVTLDTIQGIETRLSYAFMLNSSIQRAGERVTAEEIRFMAGELEDALGGVYSILSLELQLPFTNRIIHMMEKEGKLPSLPKNIVQPTIVTGLEALGRGHDLQKLDLFVRGMAENIGIEALSKFLNVGDYIKRRATALGIDTQGLIKSEQQLQEEAMAQQQAMQQQQMAQMVEKLGPNAISAIGKGITNNQ